LCSNFLLLGINYIHIYIYLFKEKRKKEMSVNNPPWRWNSSNGKLCLYQDWTEIKKYFFFWKIKCENQFFIKKKNRILFIYLFFLFICVFKKRKKIFLKKAIILFNNQKFLILIPFPKHHIAMSFFKIGDILF